MYSGDPLGITKDGPDCGACGIGNSAQANCNGLGPEYRYVGASPDCGACKFNCVNFGAFGTACTDGARPRCQKYQHLGATDMCCLGIQPPEYPMKTCDPKLGPTYETCSPFLQQYCSINDRIFNDPKCKSWASVQPQLAFNVKKSKCPVGEIKNNQNCRNWVMSGEAQGKIDDIMVAQYCQQVPDDPLCTCVMSTIPCPNKFDVNCVNKGGYKTSDMVNSQCPNVLNCNQFLSLSPGAQALATNVEQDCKSKIINNGGGNTPIDNGGGSTPINNGGDSSNTTTPINTWNSKIMLQLFLIFLIIVLFVILGVTIYWYVSKKKSEY